jgi:ribonucleoside-diphosphate reductase alpha chain
VSKTANVPNDYPFEDFKDLYLDAWRKGLVGFTTYRSGTMEAVLAIKDEGTKRTSSSTLLELLKERQHVPADARLTEEGVVMRQVYLPDEFSNGSTKKIKADGNKYYLHLSYLEGDDMFPIALWVHSNGLRPGEYVSLNRAIRSVTKLLLDSGVDNDLVLDQVDKIKDDLHHVKLGKIVSMALRHCIPLLAVIEVLSDVDGDHIASTVSAVRKFLKMHVEDGTKAQGVTCPSCGSENLIYEGGCDKCLDCGASGC